MAVDAGIVGQVLGYIGMAAASAWAVYERWNKSKAANAASVADSNAEKAVADAQTTVYGLLTKRLEVLESEVNTLRQELSVERQHSRKLELHIWKLESLMRKANLEPPVFEGGA